MTTENRKRQTRRSLAPSQMMTRPADRACDDRTAHCVRCERCMRKLYAPLSVSRRRGRVCWRYREAVAA